MTTIAKKIQLLRTRLGLTLTQAKEALVISLEGVTLDDHQEDLARQLAEEVESEVTQSPCGSCKDLYPHDKLTFSSDQPKLKGERYCSKLCKLEREC